MTEIRKIKKSDVVGLLENRDFWNLPFLAISKHRLFAQLKNPNLNDNDTVLLLAYLNNELVGYMGVFMDNIRINNIDKRIGWLSTWWVHPKTKGTGVGRNIFETMYTLQNGKIGISQFTLSAKRIYDKSGYFQSLKINHGLKTVLRSNLQFVIPAVFPSTNKIKPFFNAIDITLNCLINLKLTIQKKLLQNNLKDVSVEYLNFIDNETNELINQNNTADLSQKSNEFFEWLKAYNWVEKAPLLNLTEIKKYEFSMHDKDFDLSLIKIKKNKKCIAFVVLQKRNYVAKVLFTYYDNKEYSKTVANIIKLENIAQNTREIICYDKAICEEFKKSWIFLYRTKKTKESIISKAFNAENFSNLRMNFGDGDCSFA